MDFTLLVAFIIMGVFAMLNFGLWAYVIYRLSSRRGPTTTIDPVWGRAYLEGWQHKDLRLVMIGWTVVGLLFGCSFCSFMVILFRLV